MYLGSIYADDPVSVACAVKEEGNGDGLFARRKPVLLGVGIYLEDMCPCRKDGLLPERRTNEKC